VTLPCQVPPDRESLCEGAVPGLEDEVCVATLHDHEARGCDHCASCGGGVRSTVVSRDVCGSSAVCGVISATVVVEVVRSIRYCNRCNSTGTGTTGRLVLVLWLVGRMVGRCTAIIYPGF
jgi:hypothetical protein